MDPNKRLTATHSLDEEQPRQRVTPASPKAPGILHVLVADDEALNRLIAKATLDDLGYESTLVADGAAAVAAAASHDFDAILMDCQMPKVNGYDATRQIRQEEAKQGANKRVPIIALTASDTREECIKAGMDDYLSKPYNRDALRELLQRHAPIGRGREDG